MDRKEKILQYINRNGQGIEIGPSYDPVAPKKDGYQVEIIDYMDREQLIVKYKNWQVRPESLEKIEEVDFIWKGENYATLTGKSKYYDWIIASHVIEHVPDLIGFLNDCDAILKVDGVISLVIPDKRYCFDHFRPISGISKIIDNHISGSRLPTPGAVAEFYLNRVSKADRIAWDSNTTGEYKVLHSMEQTLQEMKAVAEGTYVDTHVWCFVPHSFRLIIQDLFQLGMTPFREIGFHSTEGCEFFITLGRRGSGINMSRLDMLTSIEVELRDEQLSSIPLEPQGTKRRSFIDRLFQYLR
jgi:hypothetical protein